MKLKSSLALAASVLAIAAALPAGAAARHGSDDPVTELRHGADDARTELRHARIEIRHARGADDVRAGDRRGRGSDDGAGHH